MRRLVLAAVAAAAALAATPVAHAEGVAQTVCVDDGVVAAESVCAEVGLSVEWDSEPICTDFACATPRKPKPKPVLHGWCNGQLRPLPCDIPK